MNSKTILTALAFCAVSAPIVNAHFKLVEPASAIVESKNGDPQKAFPCGVSANPTAAKPTLTNSVTKLKGGQKLKLKVEETVFHPGHYRVAIAGDRAKLPVDPKVATEMAAGRRGGPPAPQSVSAEIDKNPKPPVLADGLFVHVERAATPINFETDLDVPNVNCPKCVLQVIQFMAAHGLNAEGDYSYHHCADVEITMDSAKPANKAWADFLAAK